MLLHQPGLRHPRHHSGITATVSLLPAPRLCRCCRRIRRAKGHQRKGEEQNRTIRLVCGSCVSIRQRQWVREVPCCMEMARPLTTLGSAIAWGHSSRAWPPAPLKQTCKCQQLGAVSWPRSAQLRSEPSVEGGRLHPPPTPTV